MRGTVLAAVTAAFIIGSIQPAAGSNDGAGVRGTDPDRFVVRGSDRDWVPGGDGGGSSGCGAQCPPRLVTPVCVSDRFGVPPAPGQPCVTTPSDCPPGQEGRRVWTEIDGVWSPGAEFCAAAAEVPVAAIRSAVVERVRHRVPALYPARQPARRALVSLPVLFDSGQSGGTRTWTDEVAGFTVTTTVSPRWQWDFGDGATLATDVPGSTYPDLTVSHTYRIPGRRTVTVRTIWDGTFSIAGAGEYPITGQVTQDAGLDVPVVEARAVLVPGAGRRGTG